MTLKQLGTLIERYQVLIAGILAILAALIAYRGAEDQGKLTLEGARVQAKATLEAIQKQLAASSQETSSRRAAYARFEVHNLISYASRLEDYIDRFSQTSDPLSLVNIISQAEPFSGPSIIKTTWEQQALLSVEAQGGLEKSLLAVWCG